MRFKAPRWLFLLLSLELASCGPTQRTTPGVVHQPEVPLPAASGAGQTSQPPASQTAPDPAPSVPPPLEVPLVEGDIGTKAPTTLIAASPAANWVALCQARQDVEGNREPKVTLGAHGEPLGDPLRPYFVENSGLGIAIDAFLGGDPTGRYVAYLAAGRVILRDVLYGTSTDLSSLGADPRDDRSSYRSHRAVSFDPSGRFLVYLRRDGETVAPVLRALSDGQEWVVDPGPGVLWRAEFEPDGAFLRLSIATRDTNGNRRIGWSVPPRPELREPCPGPVPRFSVPEHPGDQATIRLLRLSDLALFEVNGFVTTVGSWVVTRNETGELWMDDGQERYLVASEQCSGRILHANASTPSLLVGCGKTWGQRRQLLFRSKEVRISYDWSVAPFETDGRWPEQPERIVLNPGNDSILIHLDTGQVDPLPEGTHLLAAYRDSLLVRRAGQLYFLDAQGALNPTEVRDSTLEAVQHRGRFALVGSRVFDLERQRIVRELEEIPLAMTAHGHALVASHHDGPFAIGPLRWRHAESTPTSPPP